MLTLWLAVMPDEPPQTLTGQYPWITDLIAALVALAIITLFVYLWHTGAVGSGFTIHVDDEEIAFTGGFPPNMQGAVIEFLRHDCRIAGSYRIRGHWDGQRLVVAVLGDNARSAEQQIRNFLKLTLKPPRRSR